MSHTQTYLAEAREVIERIDVHEVEKMVGLLRAARDSGARIFFLGIGGSAANASHAVNDFRKIVGFEAYAPTDNVSELTARINDDGWNSVFANWLKGSCKRKLQARTRCKRSLQARTRATCSAMSVTGTSTRGGASASSTQTS